MDDTLILLVDDDVELCELLQTYLSVEGFKLQCVHAGDAALAELEKAPYELLILDVMMPGMDGFEVLRNLRQRHSLPVLMLTAKGDEVDRIVGLELGADDYLAKPFNPRELLARLRAILRRVQARPNPSDELEVGALLVNTATRSVTYESAAVELTSAEFALLVVLMEWAGQVVSREDLSSQGLGRKLLPYDRSVDVHIGKLRRKLSAADDTREWIAAVRGRGYQLLGSGS